MPSLNSFGAAGELRAGGRSYKIFRLSALEKAGVNLARIPFSIKVLLENLLRNEDNTTVKKSDIDYVAKWDPTAAAQEINFRPARVLLQDFTVSRAWLILPRCATHSRRSVPIRRKPTPSSR